MAGAIALLSALSVEAGEPSPDGLRLRNYGWTANLFVAPAQRRALLGGAVAPGAPGTHVNARIWRRVARHTVIAVEVLNVFGHEPPAALSRDFFSPEPRGRGLRLQLRRTF